VGKNTVASMQSGIILGFVGLIDGIVKRMKEEVRTDPFVVATGGLAQLIAQETEAIDAVDELLILKGLRIIFERNK
jgi:type III pantothenate kinase